MIVWDVRGERRLGRPFRFDPVAAAGEGVHTAAENASTAVAVSPDNSLFATSPAPAASPLWRASDQAVSAELHGPFGYVVSLAFSHDGRLLAVTGNAPNTVVWNVATRKIVRILRSPVSAGARRRRLLARRPSARDLRRRHADAPALLRVYDLRTGRLIGNVVTRHNTLQDLDFTPGRPAARERGARRQDPRLGRRAARARAHDPAPRRDPHDPLLARREDDRDRRPLRATSTSGTPRPGGRSGTRSAGRTATSSASPTSPTAASS